MKRLLVAIPILLLGQTAVHAEDFPTRPIRMIAPVLPGGAPDFVGRIVADRLSTRVNQKVIVDNRPGAGGIVGLEILKASPPNGYTVASVQMGPLTVTPFLQDKLSYDPVRDFTHISGLLKFPLLLAAHPSLPAGNVKALIALARSRPGEISYASSGNGGTVHISAELFNLMAKVKMSRIQYRSIAPAVTAVLSGEAHLTYSNIPAILPHVRSKRVRALGISSAERNPFLPEIPTISESGLPGYEAFGGAGMVGPANMPTAVLQRLNREVTAILESKDVRDLMVPQGMLPAPSSPQEFTAYIKAEQKKWEQVVKAANMKAQ